MNWALSLTRRWSRWGKVWKWTCKRTEAWGHLYPPKLLITFSPTSYNNHDRPSTSKQQQIWLPLELCHQKQQLSSLFVSLNRITHLSLPFRTKFRKQTSLLPRTSVSKPHSQQQSIQLQTASLAHTLRLASHKGTSLFARYVGIPDMTLPRLIICASKPRTRQDTGSGSEAWDDGEFDDQ